jgi:hypothetical protein
MNYATGWRAWIPRATLIVAILIVLGVGLSEPLTERVGDIAPVAFVVQHVLWAILPHVIGLWMVAAMLFAERRRAGVAKAALIVSAFIICTMAPAIASSAYVAILARLYYWFRAGVYLPLVFGFPEIAVTAALMCVPRFDKKWRVVQALAVGTLIAVMWLHATLPARASAANDGYPIQVLATSFFGFLALIFGGWLAWLSWFKQSRVGVGGKNLSAHVSLTCPRCATLQHLALGGDNCRSCGARILVAIQEAT